MRRVATPLVLLLAGVGLSAAVLSVPASAQELDQTIDLRPAWEEGHAATYEFTNVRASESSVQLPSRTVDTEFEIRSEGRVNWTVDRVNDDGSAECTMTLEWMVVTFTTPDGRTVTNDTRRTKGDQPAMHGLLKAMAGKPVQIGVAADGSIEEIGGLKAMRDAADDADLVPDERDFTETATELAVIAGVPGALAVGDDWSVDHVWNYGIVALDIGTIAQEWDFTLESVEEIEGVPIAVVRGEADDMKLDDEALQEQQSQGMPETRVRLTDAEATSQVLFDLTRREAVGRYATMRTTLALELTLPNGQKIPRTVTETVEGTTLRVAED